MSDLTRSEFFKGCLMGFCACAAPAAVSAQSASAPANPEVERVKSQLEAARLRYGLLVQILDTKLDETKKREILDALGRECARQYRAMTFEKYRGDIDGFLRFVQGPEGWVEKVDYDKAAGTIRIVDRSTRCSCPLVQRGITPATQCQCTLGWQRETYSAILGQPVDATLEQSILRGDARCVFVVRVLPRGTTAPEL
jgi:predicted hydrocarbon binding protein